MPVYEAWIPVTAFVKVQLEADETNLHRVRGNSKKLLIDRFREEGSTEAYLCEDCKINVLMEDEELDFEIIDPNEIEVAKVED
jgi:hypothetical protein